MVISPPRAAAVGSSAAGISIAAPETEVVMNPLRAKPTAEAAWMIMRRRMDSV